MNSLNLTNVTTFNVSSLSASVDVNFTKVLRGGDGGVAIAPKALLVVDPFPTNEGTLTFNGQTLTLDSGTGAKATGLLIVLNPEVAGKFSLGDMYSKEFEAQTGRTIQDIVDAILADGPACPFNVSTDQISELDCLLFEAKDVGSEYNVPIGITGNLFAWAEGYESTFGGVDTRTFTKLAELIRHSNLGLYADCPNSDRNIILTAKTKGTSLNSKPITRTGCFGTTQVLMGSLVTGKNASSPTGASGYIDGQEVGNFVTGRDTTVTGNVEFDNQVVVFNGTTYFYGNTEFTYGPVFKNPPQCVNGVWLQPTNPSQSLWGQLLYNKSDALFWNGSQISDQVHLPMPRVNLEAVSTDTLAHQKIYVIRKLIDEDTESGLVEYDLTGLKVAPDCTAEIDVESSLINVHWPDGSATGVPAWHWMSGDEDDGKGTVPSFTDETRYRIAVRCDSDRIIAHLIYQWKITSN